jgi:glycosyltransferase involved in cell wall biosynthesis
MAKIVVVSDFSFQGSGYLNIIVPLCKGLAELGHEIKAVGLGYRGEEHDFDFSILPCQSMTDAQAMTNNLKYQWGAEIMLVALDIPIQGAYINLAKQLGIKIISITPLENPPLTMSWAFMLQNSDKVFFISQLGADEAQRAGVETAEHLVVGMDTKSWRLRTTDEYTKGRQLFNISPDTLVVLTVADNQERKNLSKAMEIVSKVKGEGIKVKYILVTREHSEVGWKLRDLAMDYDIASELMIFERGMSFGELYSLYAIADVFLLTSKAEGLGMPVMEAMSVGVPVVATNCGAMPELLGTEFPWERGFLMETEYSMIDPWGNSRRDFPSAESGVSALLDVYGQKDSSPLVSPNRARIYMESRIWDYPIEQVNSSIRELLDAKV